MLVFSAAACSGHGAAFRLVKLQTSLHTGKQEAERCADAASRMGKGAPRDDGKRLGRERRGLLKEKRSTLRSHTQCTAMTDAAHCEATCSALHRPSHRSAFCSPFACPPPHGEFRPRPQYAAPCQGTPQKPFPLYRSPLSPQRLPGTRHSPRRPQAIRPCTAGKAARPHLLPASV